eukprot:6222133-Alexandrium_andersonii.AAC.1
MARATLIISSLACGCPHPPTRERCVTIGEASASGNAYVACCNDLNNSNHADYMSSLAARWMAAWAHWPHSAARASAKARAPRENAKPQQPDKPQQAMCP